MTDARQLALDIPAPPRERDTTPIPPRRWYEVGGRRVAEVRVHPDLKELL